MFILNQQFVSERQIDDEVGNAKGFVCDVGDLTQRIQTFGKGNCLNVNSTEFVTMYIPTLIMCIQCSLTTKHSLLLRVCI